MATEEIVKAQIVDRTRDALNLARLTELYKLALDQEAGCIFISPINILVSHGKIIPRDLVTYITALTQGSLHLSIENSFFIWTKLLPYLNMQLKKMNVYSRTFTLSGKNIEDVVKDVGFTDIEFKNISQEPDFILDPELDWMFIMMKDQLSDMHILSTKKGLDTDAIVNVGGQREYDHYVQQGYSVVASLGLQVK